MHDALRNDDAPDTAVVETAVLDALEARLRLEDDLVKLSAVSEGKLPNFPDTAGDHHFADVAFPEPAVTDDLEAVR